MGYPFDAEKDALALFTKAEQGQIKEIWAVINEHSKGELSEAELHLFERFYDQYESLETQYHRTLYSQNY